MFQLPEYIYQADIIIIKKLFSIINFVNRLGGKMAKKIAVLVRERKHEALRMALGSTLAQDEVNVFIMDGKLEEDEEISMSLKVKIYSNNPDNNFEQKSTEEIALALPGYDVVIPY
jgi:hypothetical protein